MPLDLVTVPCLSDNYAYLLRNEATGQTALVDAPESEAIAHVLDRKGWALTDILLTHHHDDHLEGTAALRARDGARVIGAAADAHRLPPLDLAVAPGDTIEVCGEAVEVIDASGHTLGHVAYYLPDSRLAFTADSLMALGCGRLFEGTAEQMWESLSRLAALPPDTMICSGHEYTANNARFALTIEPGNAALTSRHDTVMMARSNHLPTVPSLLADELATNPFLRAGEASVKAALGMETATDAEVFAEIRRRKDSF